MSMKVEYVKVYGFAEAVRGMRNSWNSWEKSDSDFGLIREDYILGPRDIELMKKLIKGGPSHCKFRRDIIVTMDITAPFLWWKQMDTYSVGTTGLSTSTMHSITDKKFDISDFTSDHLSKLDTSKVFGFTSSLDTRMFMDGIIEYLNKLRDGALYYESIGEREIAKRFKRIILDILPSNYMQRRTWLGNYEVLSKIRMERKGHFLDEWDAFIERVDNLPYAEELIIGG